MSWSSLSPRQRGPIRRTGTARNIWRRVEGPRLPDSPFQALEQVKREVRRKEGYVQPSSRIEDNMPRSCYIQLSAIDGPPSLSLSSPLPSSMRRRSWPAYTIRCQLQQQLARAESRRSPFKTSSGKSLASARGEKKKRKKKKEEKRGKKKNRVLSPLIARSTGMPSVPPWEQEVNDPRQIAGNATPCLRFPFFFRSTGPL